MTRQRTRAPRLRTALLTCAALCAGTSMASAHGTPSERRRPPRTQPATHTSPIALSSDDALLWAVSPETDSVTVIRTDTQQVVAKIPVGDNPQSVAVDAQGRRAYVANAGSNELTIIDIRDARPDRFSAAPSSRSITTGAAPSGVVLSPDGRRVFVSNASQDTITVLDAQTTRILGSVDLRSSACNADDRSRHFQPRAMAITPDSRRLYVTRYLSFTRPGGKQREDDGKEGLVCRVDLSPLAASRTGVVGMSAIRLASGASGIADRNGQMTGAFPNQLHSIVVRDGHAYLPNVGASPRGPLRFDVDTHALVSRIDDLEGEEKDAGFLNLHLGGRDPEPGAEELYFANLSGIAFTSAAGQGSAYAIASGSDIVVKLAVDAKGALGFTVDEDTTRYIDLNDPDSQTTAGANAGKNPVGIVIDQSGSKAYVLNNVSRNVSIVDLATDRVEAVVAIEALPPPGSREEVLLVGAEMFQSSRGNFIHPTGAGGSSRNRLSDKGRQSCASCHPGGLTDGIIWQFASGPRKTIAVNGTFNPRNTSEQRVMNASAIFDELEDADLNTRRVSSGEPLTSPRACVEGEPGAISTNDPDHGLILGEEGDFEKAACVINAFTRPNENRPQPEVQLPGSPVKVRAHDALKEWQRSGIVTPNRPLTAAELSAAGVPPVGAPTELRVREGERLFDSAGCVSCHGGGHWTKSKKDFPSPPAASEISTEMGVPTANQLQFLHRFLSDIGSYGLNVEGSSNVLPGQLAIGGIERDTNELDALGRDHNGDGRGNGFNTPSLLGTYSIPPYYHNGACETLRCVVADQRHRRAGLPAGAPDPLDSPSARESLILYLESIDEAASPHEAR